MATAATEKLKSFAEAELKNYNLEENVKVEFEEQTASYCVHVHENHESSYKTFFIWRPMTENQVKKVIKLFFESNSKNDAE